MMIHDRFDRIMALSGIDFSTYYSSRDQLSDLSGVSMGRMINANQPKTLGEYLESIVGEGGEDNQLYFTVPNLGGSDYSGCTYTKANHNTILESFGDSECIWDMYGGYNSYDILFGLSELLQCPQDIFDEILDNLESLEDYPILDEQELYKVEDDAIQDAWDSWAMSDYTRAIEKTYEDDSMEFEWPDSNTLFSLFVDIAERANEYWYNEGSGQDMIIDIDKVANATTLEDIEHYALRYRVVWEDMGQNSEVYFAEQDAIDHVTTLRESGHVEAHYEVLHSVATTADN